MTKGDLRSLIESLKVQVISENSSNFICLCPVHGEKNPSFGVSFSKPGHPYNCFSCGVSGTNIQSLVWSLLGQPKMEEVRRYVRSFGELDDFILDKVPETSEVVRDDSIVALPEYHLTIYKKLLKFRGYSSDFLCLVKLRQDNEGAVIVPFFRGEKLIGVIRKTHNRKTEALNSFSFKQHLYFVKDEEIVKKHPIILVEGFTDALRLYSLGFKNVAAINGTSFTRSQERELRKISLDKAILMFDDDRGGIAAAKNVVKRLPDYLLWSAMDYPKGKNDPDNLGQIQIKKMLASKRVILSAR